MLKKVPIVAVVALLGVAGIGYSFSAYADTVTATTVDGFIKGNRQPGMAGTVTAINGTIITITGKDSTSYTIDGSAATYTKFSKPTTSSTTERTKPAVTTITVGDIKVGDTIMARGMVSGTEIVATEITSGAFMKGHGMGEPKNGTGVKPAVGGIIQSINGSVVTVLGRDNSTYTIDVSGATIKKDGTPGAEPTTGTEADIIVGNMLMAQGTLSGTHVIATEVMTGVKRTDKEPREGQRGQPYP